MILIDMHVHSNYSDGTLSVESIAKAAKKRHMAFVSLTDHDTTEGLAPLLVAQVAEYLQEMKVQNISVLLVEQKLDIALKISQRIYVMGHGKIVFTGTPDDLQKNEHIRREWLEV